MKAPVIDLDQEEATKETTAPKRKEAPQNLPFKINDLHKKALVALFHSHHSGILLTYADLSLAIGIGEKTKRWQCEAWKHLKRGEYIVSGPEKGTFCLSPEGLDLATCFVTDEELADYKAPVSNDELHKKIRKKLDRDTKNGKKHKGSQIFDLLLKVNEESRSLTRLEIANELKTGPDAHGFFYGFKALQKMNLVTVTDTISRKELERKYELLPSTRKKKEEEEEEEPKKKKRKRIRGGLQLFGLSEKAFLATVRKQAQEQKAN